MKTKNWTEHELEILKNNYGKVGKEEMMGMLHDRSWNAIKIAGRINGLAKKDAPNWSDKEINLLKINWHNTTKKDVINLFQNRSFRAIKAMTQRLSLKCNENLRKRIYNVNDNFFSTPNILNSYYSGWLAGDGNISNGCVSIGLQEKDKELIEGFKKDVEYDGPLYFTKGGVGKIQGREYIIQNKISLNINNSKIILDLNKNWNITSNKSLTYTGPKSHGYENDLAFLSGLIESDGSIGVHKFNNKTYKKIYKYPYFFVGAANKQLIEYVSFFIKNKFNLIVSVYQTQTKNSIDFYYIQKIGKACLPFLRALRDLPCPHLSRKWNNPDLIKFLNGEEVVPEDIDNAETDANIDTEEIIDKNNIIQNSTIISTTSHV